MWDVCRHTSRLGNKTALVCLTACLSLSGVGLAEPADGNDSAPTEQRGPSQQTADTKNGKPAEPFAFADFSWAPASYAPPESPFNLKYFTPEIRLDAAYHYSFNHPIDHTISGSSEVFRHNELQITQIGVGGNLDYKHVMFRLMTQFGMYSSTTPRNDASPSRGQWNLDSAYRYISEAYAGYHLDVWNGINIQAGIFMSYIGLWSYYNFDNWTYQPSFVSSNTPWFFNGVRAQIFPSDRLKIEPWLVNGWQSYGMFNEQPGLGVQINYRPTGSLSFVTNDYYGADALGIPNRKRAHSDNSVMVKYHDNQGSLLSKAAASLTVDAGCEDGGGVACGDQYFLGFMAYNRLWFDHDQFGLTFGGGAINNPGRYLVLVPPIAGATAATGTPSAYFNSGAGNFWAWDTQLTGDYMPTRNITLRLEYNHRWASVPYWAGPGGMTPPTGVVLDPATGKFTNNWSPDLRQSEDRITVAMLVRL